MPRTPFLVSHHTPEHYDRCVDIGGWMVCTRCLGLYPLMLALIAAQIALRAPKALGCDPWVALLLPLPALVDWARGRFQPRSGSNALRFVTGLLLAPALARTLYLHLRSPFHALAVAQLSGMALVAVVVEILARRRRQRAADRADDSTVEPPSEAG
jgi:uncharacterized membrane protein